MEYDTSVWAIVGQLKALNWNVTRVASDYAISEEAVREVVRYYQQHKQAIDARLQANLPPTSGRDCEAGLSLDEGSVYPGE